MLGSLFQRATSVGKDFSESQKELGRVKHRCWLKSLNRVRYFGETIGINLLKRLRRTQLKFTGESLVSPVVIMESSSIVVMYFVC